MNRTFMVEMFYCEIDKKFKNTIKKCTHIIWGLCLKNAQTHETTKEKPCNCTNKKFAWQLTRL